MNTVWAYIRQLVGNGKAATIGILLFIIILAILAFRPTHAAELDFSAGSSFGAEGYGPVLGLEFKQPVKPNVGLSVLAGTDLWGSTTYKGETVANNWDWHTGLEACRWHVCASLGAAYVQRVDVINGAHTNYRLGLSWQITDRLALVLGHLSDAGTSDPNIGRQALSISYRFQ